MNTTRLAIAAGLAVAIAIIAATQTCRDRSPAEANEPVAKVEPKGGVGPRAADPPLDFRERDRLRDDEAATPAGVISAPETADRAVPEPPPRPLEDPQAEAEPTIVVGPPPSPTAEAAMAAAKAAAQDEVAKVRREMRRKCWDGSKGDGGVPLSFSLSFDAEGHMLTSAVHQESRENYVPGLETCLAPFAHSIEVPAPGEPVSVQVDLELP